MGGRSLFHQSLKLTLQASSGAAGGRALGPEIERVWRSHRRVYGAKKVWKRPNRETIAVARCTVARLMRVVQLGTSPIGEDGSMVPSLLLMRRIRNGRRIPSLISWRPTHRLTNSSCPTRYPL